MKKVLRKIRLRQDEDSDTLFELLIQSESIKQSRTTVYQSDFIAYGSDASAVTNHEVVAEPQADLNEVEKAFIDKLAQLMAQGFIQEDTQLKPEAASPARSAKSKKIEELRQRLNKAKHLGDIKVVARVIWYIGETKQKNLAPDIVDCIDLGNDFLNYCVAWSLGRLQLSQSLEALEVLRNTTQSEMVARIALEAILNIVKKRQKNQMLKEVTASLPESVRKALKDKNIKDSSTLVDQQFDALLKTQGVGVSNLFYNLYLVSLISKQARIILLGALKKIPLSANFFKALRQLFKMAEFRFDPEVYGILAYRLETTPSPYGKNAWEYEFIRLPDSYEYVSFEEEMEKPDCRLAYSAKSRDYLRRRTWRFLRKLLTLEIDKYTEFACHMLLPYQDTDGNQEHISIVSDWRPEEDGQWKKVVVEKKKYSAYSSYYAFNQILFAKSQRFKRAHSGKAWLDKSGSEPIQGEDFQGDFADLNRLEAYPELWDKRPDLLLKLLSESQCRHVHRFAAVALFANKEYCMQLSEASLLYLLQSPYLVTAAFALEIVKQRYQKSDSATLISTLLSSHYVPAREYGINKFEEYLSRLLSAERIFDILVNPNADIRQWGIALLKQHPLDKKATVKLLDLLFEYLLAIDLKQHPDNESSKTIQAITVDISQVLQQALSEYLNTVEMRIIEQLLHHSSSSVQAVAGQVLINHSVSAEFLPVKVFHALIESKADNVREVGLKLFQQLPKPVLISQAEMLASFCLSEHEQIRNTVRKVLIPLVSETPELGVKLVNLLLNQLFSKAKFDGYKNYILAIVYNDLSSSLKSTDKKTVLRLLQTDNRTIQQLGAKLLVQCQPSLFDTAQWCDLASHPLYEVRQWAWKAFENNVDQVKEQAIEALRLLDSSWEETRQFAMRFFLNYFKESDWTPDILIAICDNERREIQKFGCELILDFFQEGQGMDYLMKLSQHSGLEMQEFALNFLNQNASGQLDRINALMPFFKVILLRVGQGRQLKNKVYTFIHKQVCNSEEIARLFVPLLNSLLTTCVRVDKERVIEILNDMLHYFPYIETPLQRESIVDLNSLQK